MIDPVPTTPANSYQNNEPMAPVSTQPRRSRMWQYILGGALLVLLIAGAAAGFYLSQQQQDIRQQAYVIPNPTPDIGFCTWSDWGSCIDGKQVRTNHCVGSSCQNITCEGREERPCGDSNDYNPDACSVGYTEHLPEDVCTRNGQGRDSYQKSNGDWCHRCVANQVNCYMLSEGCAPKTLEGKTTCNNASEFSTRNACESILNKVDLKTCYEFKASTPPTQCNAVTVTAATNCTSVANRFNTAIDCVRARNEHMSTDDHYLCWAKLGGNDAYAKAVVACDSRWNDSTCSCGNQTPTTPTTPTNPSNRQMCTWGDTSKPVAEYLKFTCPNGCLFQDDGTNTGNWGWQCFEGRVSSSSMPTYDMDGDCFQIDYLSQAGNDASYCGHITNCNLPRCQRQTTPSPEPSPTPTPGPQCLSITMSNPQPKMGDSVTFTCGQVAGAARYVFQVVGPNRQPVQLTATGRVSAPFTINLPGTYTAQCQICTGAAANTCHAFEPTASLNVPSN